MGVVIAIKPLSVLKWAGLRATKDKWQTYFDFPAELIQHDDLDGTDLYGISLNVGNTKELTFTCFVQYVYGTALTNSVTYWEPSSTKVLKVK